MSPSSSGVHVRILPTVLFIDDDADVRFACAEAARLHDFEADTASDGYEALGKIGVLHPDVIVLDFRLPDFDGAALIHQLRITSPSRDIPIVLLCRMPEAVAARVARENACAGWLTKPCSMADLMDRIRRGIRVRASHRAASNHG